MRCLCINSWMQHAQTVNTKMLKRGGTCRRLTGMHQDPHFLVTSKKPTILSSYARVAATGHRLNASERAADSEATAMERCMIYPTQNLEFYLKRASR